MRAPIPWKRETKGNESGNERETKRRFLCDRGNEAKPGIGNEGAFFRRLRFHRPLTSRDARASMKREQSQKARREIQGDEDARHAGRGKVSSEDEPPFGRATAEAPRPRDGGILLTRDAKLRGNFTGEVVMVCVRTRV